MNSEPVVTAEGQLYLDSVLPIPSLTHWCSVRYYEGSEQAMRNDTRCLFLRQVSASLYMPRTQSRLGIDGFCYPFSPFMNAPRLSVGHLTNLHQSFLSAQIRSQIRRGIVLEADADGDIWLEILEPYAICVQSCYLNGLRGYTALDYVVHTIAASQLDKVKLFDLQKSRVRMIEEFRAAEDSVRRTLNQLQLGTVSILSPQTSVDQLRPLATVLISFVGDWKVTRTGHVQATPCWIEVQHLPAFKIMDLLLTAGRPIAELFPLHRLYGSYTGGN